MPKPAANNQRKVEQYTDYVARIERSALSYGVNNYHQKYEQPFPNSRLLLLFGTMLLPKNVFGWALVVTLVGREPQPDTPEPETLRPHVAHLERHGEQLGAYAAVAPDYVPTLSSAYHDRRLHLFYGRGPKLFRNSSLLTSISFENEPRFVEYWGEPLPSFPG